MRTLRMREAAALLNVSPSTLRSWEQRFGYPRPHRSDGGQRRYEHAELVALRDALQSGLGVASAISQARQGMGVDPASLHGVLLGLRFGHADAVMEGALALRPLEGAVEDILLPAIERLGRELGPASARWALIGRWASGWLSRAHRLSAPPRGEVSILIADASAPRGIDAAAVAALELFCARDGARVLRLPVDAPDHAAEVALAAQPEVMVLSGADVPRDTLARWMFPMRRVLDDAMVLRFRAAAGAAAVAAGERPQSACLPDSPLAAQRELSARMSSDPLVVRVSRMGSALPVPADAVSLERGQPRPALAPRREL